MRILLVAPQPFFQERGTPLAVLLLIKALCAQGHRVDLLTYPEGRNVEIEGLRIIRTPAIPGASRVPIGISWKKLAHDALLCCALFWRAARYHYDVIHAVEEAVFPAVVLRVLTRKRVIYDMDSHLGDQLTRRWPRLRGVTRPLCALENATISHVDAVFAVCADLASHVRAVAPNVPVFLIEDVALEEHDAPIAAEPLRETYGITSTLALYVGNLEDYQGVRELVEAMAVLGPGSDITLVLVGGGPEEVAKLQHVARNLGVERRVVALGARPVASLSGYLSQADILVSPRRHGSNTPMKVYSYMLAGKGILATRIPAHTQVLDEECALLVAPNSQSIAQGLTTLAVQPELRERLGAAAHTRAATRHSLDSFREKVRAAYRAVGALQSSCVTKASHP